MGLRQVSFDHIKLQKPNKKVDSAFGTNFGSQSNHEFKYSPWLGLKFRSTTILHIVCHSFLSQLHQMAKLWSAKIVNL
jgi:hypothetical protein